MMREDVQMSGGDMSSSFNVELLLLFSSEKAIKHNTH